MPELLTDLEFWKYVSIPFVAGIVGWGTNWVAVKMTFLPKEFVGITPPIGWQGIIPSKATKMAGIFVDTSMARLGKLSELFEELDPDRIAAHISDSLAPHLKEYTDEIVGRAQCHRHALQGEPRRVRPAAVRPGPGRGGHRHRS